MQLHSNSTSAQVNAMMKKAASTESLTSPLLNRSSSMGPASDVSFQRSNSQNIPTSHHVSKKKKKKKHQNPFVDSLRDFLEELPMEQNKRKLAAPLQDEIGEAMTEILNSDPRFSCPDDGSVPWQEEESVAFFRPLISLQNWRRLQALLVYFKCVIPHCNLIRDAPTFSRSIYQYIFWNAKTSATGFILAFVGLSLVFVCGVAAASALLSTWVWRFVNVAGMLVISTLVDWDDISTLLPSFLVNSICKLSKALIWIDQDVLHGKRFRGREWNKDDFEMNRPSNTARSSYRQQYLWKLPPPTVQQLGLEHCANIEHLQRSEWGIDSVEHVAAIDFCYLVMREEFVHSKLRKLRQSVFKKYQSEANRLEKDVVSDGYRISQERFLSFDDEITLELEQYGTANKISDPSPIPNVAIDKEISIRLLDILENDKDNDDQSQGVLTNHSREDSSNLGSETGKDLNWMDVGAEIGMKLLGSAAIQKAMTSHDTAEKINTLKDKVGSHMAAMDNPSFDLDDPRGGSADVLGEEFGLRRNDHLRMLPNGKLNAMSLPVHSMWTSAAAAVPFSSSIDTHEEKDSRLLHQLLQSKASEESVDQTFDNKGFDTSAEDISKGWQDSSQRSSCTKNGFEMICDTADYRTISIKSQTPRSEVFRWPLLLPGVKIVVPIFPFQPGGSNSTKTKETKSKFQMGTVVASKRLCVYRKNQMPQSGNRTSNCLAITVELDKCFLRNGEFATLTLRVMDEWGPRYMPRHSKLPLGSCVSTSFGLGVLVGWRVEDDCHVVRCLWQHRGPGSACAYLQRDAIHSTMEAAIGFEVATSLGRGRVVAYTHGGEDFRCGRYFVSIAEEGRHCRQVLELNRSDILSCASAQFVPIVEHIREAAQYQLQIDFYEELLSERDFTDEDNFGDSKILGDFSKHFNILWKSFLNAIDQDDEFDEGMNAFIQSCVNFLDQLDGPDFSGVSRDHSLDTNVLITTTESSSQASRIPPSVPMKDPSERTDAGTWVMDNLFGIFRSGVSNGEQEHSNASIHLSECVQVECTPRKYVDDKFDRFYKRAFAVIRTLMRTITIAQAHAASTDDPDFKMVLSIFYEFLLFIKTVIKVQRKNMNPESLIVWRRAWNEIVSVFGPVKDRLTRIAEGIAERMEKQGRRAKVKLLRFVDILVQDEIILAAVEQGEWARCVEQIELALVRAKIIDESSREHYHRTTLFLYNHFASANAQSKKAAARNNEKMAQFLMILQLLASPRKAILRLFLEDYFLDILERVLVRVFGTQESASRMLTIHSSNFHTLRQFRMLKDFTIAGKFWIPLLDAADEEFSWAVSKLPENAKEYLSPLSSLFSLCVVQFHKINSGDLTKDWLDFLLEDEAIDIIHELDMKLILALESFSRDVKETMLVLPYYPSIDDDILNLVDEININEFIKKASIALEDEELLRGFIKDKASEAIERFLDYIPKMSIPVEKRDLPDGWMITCRASDGGHLKLKDLVIKRENLTCQVMGGDTIFFPMLTEDLEVGQDAGTTISSPVRPKPVHPEVEETSILDHIRDIILNAQRFGCWQVGIGGINHPPSDKHAAAALRGLPVSSVLNCAIDLWRNLEIDDDELLEIAIRDVSYQIQLQKQREEEESGLTNKESKDEGGPQSLYDSKWPILMEAPTMDMMGPSRPRFNPRIDPTVLYLEIKRLTFNLENFYFRIEKHESRRTIFDPVFEGSGSLLVRNVSVSLRVDCQKDYIFRSGQDVAVPILQLRDLDVNIEKVQLRVQDTGADWLLNKVVDGFGDKFTEIMSTNLRDQIRTQIDEALTNLNVYFGTNPEVLLGLLDISLDDLDEVEHGVVYV